MNYLKPILITLLVSFGFGSFKNSLAQPTEIRSPLSYAKTILNPDYKDSFKSELGDQCFDLLYNHYKNGKNLFCKHLADTAVPLDYFTDNSSIFLYHYTKSEIPYKIFQSSNDIQFKLNSFFEFFRKRRFNDSSPYFATDSESSHYFGNYLIQFKIDPKAKILLNRNSYAFDTCTNEIDHKIPLFSKFCEISFLSYHASKLALMILEDSGIALYDYYSRFYSNHSGCSTTLNSSWLQLTGPEWILDAESVDTEENK